MSVTLQDSNLKVQKNPKSGYFTFSFGCGLRLSRHRILRKSPRIRFASRSERDSLRSRTLKTMQVGCLHGARSVACRRHVCPSISARMSRWPESAVRLLVIASAWYLARAALIRRLAASQLVKADCNSLAQVH